MNIYEFINSPDVAAHCREQNKTWNSFEMAVIIGESKRHTRTEKYAAWRELIADYPDMSAEGKRHGIADFESLHQKLAEVIEYEENLRERSIELFKQSDANVVYEYCGVDFQPCIVFSNVEAVLVHIKNLTENSDEMSKIKVIKRYMGYDISITGYFDSALNLYSAEITGDDIVKLFPDIDTDRDGVLIFDFSYYIDIPTPFKRGDILTNSYSVFVFDSYEGIKSIMEKMGHFSPCLGYYEGGWGFFVAEDGILYGDHTADVTCLEYYRGKLENNKRLYKALCKWQ
jgi:hypothetical protein